MVKEMIKTKAKPAQDYTFYNEAGGSGGGGATSSRASQFARR